MEPSSGLLYSSFMRNHTLFCRGKSEEQMKKIIDMGNRETVYLYSFRISRYFLYRGNLFWFLLCLWLLFNFIWELDLTIYWSAPLLVALLVKNLLWRKDTSFFYVSYRGSWGWIIILSIIFFPVAIILFMIKGFSIIERRLPSPST